MSAFKYTHSLPPYSPFLLHTVHGVLQTRASIQLSIGHDQEIVQRQREEEAKDDVQPGVSEEVEDEEAEARGGVGR